MTFHMEATEIARVSMTPEVRKAATAGAALISLWPLTDAKQMDNDTKYGENLQVRMTRMVARIATGEDVTVPDAEFVYEGADEIPGRPQAIVDALLAANDACDEMADYSDTGDTNLIMGGAGLLRPGWDSDTVNAVAEAIARIETMIHTDHDAHGPIASSADDEAVAQRLAIVIVATAELLELVEANSSQWAVRALPVMLYANELCERLSIPRLCFSAEQVQALTENLAATSGDSARGEIVGTLFASVAATEWERHREDVLWDPEEAKKRAKEEDERRNKEALAAKFAHVKDDPSKPEVEL